MEVPPILSPQSSPLAPHPSLMQKRHACARRNRSTPLQGLKTRFLGRFSARQLRLWRARKVNTPFDRKFALAARAKIDLPPHNGRKQRFGPHIDERQFALAARANIDLPGYQPLRSTLPVSAASFNPPALVGRRQSTRLRGTRIETWSAFVSRTVVKGPKPGGRPAPIRFLRPPAKEK